MRNPLEEFLKARGVQKGEFARQINHPASVVTRLCRPGAFPSSIEQAGAIWTATDHAVGPEAFLQAWLAEQKPAKTRRRKVAA